MNLVTTQNAATNATDKTLGTDDDQLVLRAIGGDTTAFDTLVGRHSRIVLGISRRLTGSVEDAEDVAQEAFLKAFTRLSTFRFKSSFRTWLVAIAVNQARMLNRRVRRCHGVPTVAADSDNDLPTQFDLPDPRPNPEAQYFDQERVHFLMTEISRLAPATRAAICFQDLEEMSAIDTAVLLGVTTSALKSRKSRGRSVLRQRIAKRLAPHLLKARSIDPCATTDG